MTNGEMVYWGLFILMALVGTILSGAFLVIHRPSSWKSLISLDASGWIILLFLLYIRTISLTVISLMEGNYALPSFWRSIVSFAFGIGFDALLIIRMANWLRFRREESHRHSEMSQ